MTIWQHLRDWWRGYSDADIESLRHKLSDRIYPWKIINISAAEVKALTDYGYRRISPLLS